MYLHAIQSIQWYSTALRSCKKDSFVLFLRQLYLTQGSQTRGPHVVREGVSCGPRCFSGIFKYSTFMLPSALTADAAK